MRSINDAAKEHVRPVVVETQKRDLDPLSQSGNRPFLLIPNLVGTKVQQTRQENIKAPKENWLTKERHILPAKWRKTLDTSGETQMNPDESWTDGPWGQTIGCLFNISVAIAIMVNIPRWVWMIVIPILMCLFLLWIALCVVAGLVTFLGKAWRNEL